MEKHQIYFELLDALKERGCPICFLINSRVHKLMENLLYENVNDIEIRKKIKESLGFCNLHSWQLKKFADGLGLSIIYEDLLNVIKNKIKEFLGKKGKKVEIGLNCLICREAKNIERRFISLFIEYFNDIEFKNNFKSSFGLCLPHFISVIKSCKDKNVIVELYRIETEKIELLRHELNEFQRKQDYRFSAEGYGKEKDSWIRAIEKLTGKEGVF